MGNYIEQVPPEIQGHIRRITRTSGLPQTSDALDLVAQGWIEKKNRFEKIISEMRLEEAQRMEKGDPRGCLVLTVSGSLVNIGPLRKTTRTVQYASLGLRRDVPESATNISSQLSAGVEVGLPVRFTSGPIASSSPVFKIAVSREEMDLEEQEHVISRATRALTREFIEVNRELELGEG
jgi:hypothetical protein